MKSNLAPLLVALGLGLGPQGQRTPVSSSLGLVRDGEAGDLVTNYSKAAVTADSTCSNNNSGSSSKSNSNSSSSLTSTFYVERADIIPGKEVFLLSNCFNAEECQCLIRESSIIGKRRQHVNKLIFLVVIIAFLF